MAKVAYTRMAKHTHKHTLTSLTNAHVHVVYWLSHKGMDLVLHEIERRLEI